MKIKFIIILLSITSLNSGIFEAWTEFNRKNREDVWEKITGKKNSQRSKKTDSELFGPTFKDVAGGIPNELLHLKNTILKGENYPKGILLQGPPGTGKTYLVKALANEIGVPIIPVSSAELISGWMGGGARGLKAKFTEAKTISKATGMPVILFFDEFDAIGKRYEDNMNQAVAEESRRTINALLEHMDGFSSDNKIIIIAATNHPELIDDAFKRPGRLDFIVNINLPDEAKRAEILKYYIESDKVNKFSSDIDFDELAKLTGGLNCADLKQLIVESGVNAFFMSDPTSPSVITQEHLREAIKNRKGSKKIDFVDADKKPEKQSNIKFKDVVGGVPKEILDLKAFLENDEAFEAVGAQKPTGILMVGPPGTGKTMLARALAGEVEAAFFAESASAFIEVYVGTGPKRIREIFEQANRAIADGVTKKAIIFIDEIDAIGNRNSRVGASSEENRTITELLVQMDGFNKNKNITVLAATNRVDLIDPALKRPGRFDYIIEVPLPDLQKRKAILNHYMFNKPRNIDSSIDFDSLAARTEGFNCADLQDLINRAAINAVRVNRKIILESDIEVSLKEILISKKRF